MALSQDPIAFEKALSTDLVIEKTSARWGFDLNVIGVQTEAAALLAASSVAPATVAAENFTLSLSRRRVKQIGPDAFIISHDYEPLDDDDEKNQDPPQPGTWKFSWNTAGGTHKITQAKTRVVNGVEVPCETAYTASENDPKPDLGGVIGWDGKKIHGTEIVVPKLEFSITRYIAPADLKMDLVKTLARATGKINNSVWLGFDAGELLFLGSRGDADLATVRGQRTKSIPVQLDFSASENTTDIKLRNSVEGKTITVASKKGWQYLWVRYQPMTDPTTKVVLAVPVAAYVDDVYDSIDFAAVFGFGGS